MPKITKRSVDAFVRRRSEREHFLWDSEVRGFGLRLKPSGTATYIAQYRNSHGGTRRLALGGVGTLTPDEARDLARDKLAEVRKGGDPSVERNAARKAITVAELCDLYLADARGRIG